MSIHRKPGVATTRGRRDAEPEWAYNVDPKHGYPMETFCMNVMCRAKFMREFGETEFCPACRRILAKRRTGK